MIFDNGKYRPMRDEDTAGSWGAAILLALIVMLPIWITWTIIKGIFNLIFSK